jgi:hypothetical protein
MTTSSSGYSSFHTHVTSKKTPNSSSGLTRDIVFNPFPRIQTFPQTNVTKYNRDNSSQSKSSMLNVPNKQNTYADRPVTPLGEASGLTSTPVSEHPSRQSSPKPNTTTKPTVNRYQYQPAMAWTHSSAFASACSSSNYSHAAEDVDEGHCIPTRAFKIAEDKLGDFFNRRASVSERGRHLKYEEAMDLKEVGEKKVQREEGGKGEKTIH